MQIHTSSQDLAASGDGRTSARAVSTPSSTNARALEAVRILVVEDDPPSARLFVALLGNEGAEVRVATSAEEAIRTMEVFPAQVVVLDLILPRMSGLMLAQQLKSQPSTRAAVLIAVSIANGLQTERLALDSGCATYIRKPIDIQTFAEIVLRHLKPSV